MQRFRPLNALNARDTAQPDATPLGHLIVAIQAPARDTNIETVMHQLAGMPEYFKQRDALADMARFFTAKAPDAGIKQAAEVLADRIGNHRLLQRLMR